MSDSSFTPDPPAQSSPVVDKHVSDILNELGVRGGSPMDRQITTEGLQRRINDGDISLQDLTTISTSARYAPIGSGIGAISGLPAYFRLSRSRPFSVAVAGAMLVGVTGTFLGFSLGGAWGAYRIQKDVPEATRKLRVLQEVAFDVKRAIMEQRSGIAPGTVVSHVAGVPVPDTLRGPDGQPVEQPNGQQIGLFPRGALKDQAQDLANQQKAFDSLKGQK